MIYIIIRRFVAKPDAKLYNTVDLLLILEPLVFVEYPLEDFVKTPQLFCSDPTWAPIQGCFRLYSQSNR